MNPVIKVFQPSGILDSTQASQFREEISHLVREGTEIIAIDFKEVSFMDSSGLGALVLSLKTARSAGSQIVLCSINEQIKILFELTSMDRVFEIFPTLEDIQKKFIEN